MGIYYQIGALALCFTGLHYYIKFVERHDKIMKLKNALLAHAIFRTRPYDSCNDDCYELYNGTKYPIASGYSCLNACYTYFYSPYLKMNAIEKYINNILSTQEDIDKFLQEYLTVVE